MVEEFYELICKFLDRSPQIIWNLPFLSIIFERGLSLLILDRRDAESTTDDVLEFYKRLFSQTLCHKSLKPETKKHGSKTTIIFKRTNLVVAFCNSRNCFRLSHISQNVKTVLELREKVVVFLS